LPAYRKVISHNRQSATQLVAGHGFGEEPADVLRPSAFVQQAGPHNVNQPMELSLAERNRRRHTKRTSSTYEAAQEFLTPQFDGWIGLGFFLDGETPRWLPAAGWLSLHPRFDARLTPRGPGICSLK
jgi:hypothetical protein